MNQSHSPNPAIVTRPHDAPTGSIPHPDLASVIRPHGSPPQINSIAPIQLRAPCNTPINQSHKSHPASVAPPWRAPTNQSHLSDPVAPPYDVSQPVSNPNGMLPQINPIAPIQPVLHAPRHTPINQSHQFAKEAEK